MGGEWASVLINVCNPRFWVPNTIIEGHVLHGLGTPWGTNPNGAKENSLNSESRGSMSSLKGVIQGLGFRFQGLNAD